MSWVGLLIGFVLSFAGPAQAGQSAVPLGLTSPEPGLNVWFNGSCTRTLIESTVVTAAHCSDLGGWAVDGDRAWSGPGPVWADLSTVVKGQRLVAVGFPAGIRTVFELTVLQPQEVTVMGKRVTVLMTKGVGVPCTPGSSGTVGWVKQAGEWLPVGPMAVHSTDPKITGLPAGWFICGFAL